jgi:hypothetical protein
MTAQCATCGGPLELKRDEDLGGGVETMFYWCRRCNASRDRGDQMALGAPVAPVRWPLLQLKARAGYEKHRNRRGSQGAVLKKGK